MNIHDSYSGEIDDSINEDIKDDKNLHNLSMSFKEDKSRIYNKWAESYDKYVEKEEYLGPKNLIEHVKSYFFNTTGTINILDFGCGTGLVGKEIKNSFKNLNFDITGVDISTGMILQSHKLNIYDDLVCSDIVDKNKNISEVKRIFKDKTFNLIVSCGVFLEGHVSLEAIFRVLVNLLSDYGGILAVTIRDSFLNSTPEFKYRLNQSKEIVVLEFSQIEYLKGVKAWLLIVAKN
tara:strand:+ start:354 stop:1055 length:702 start_codon:yes stop_codon:yes gene_type:complete